MNEEFPPRYLKRLMKRHLNALHDHLCVADGPHIGKQQGKFVTAHPRHHVAGGRRVLEPQGHQLQQFVSCGVAERVVDGLELIEVEEADHDFFAGVVGAAASLGQQLPKIRAVRQARQGIVQGHGAQALKCPAQIEFIHRHGRKRFEQVGLLSGKLTWTVVKYAEGPQLFSFRSAQGRARIKPDARITGDIRRSVCTRGSWVASATTITSSWVMAIEQNDTSLGVSATSQPTLALNH